MKKRIKKKQYKQNTKIFSQVKRVPTGISIFDSLINGGFKKNSVNLVVGGPGTGKTIFAIQYLINGIKKYNENALYLTFEEKKENLFDDMKSFGWDLKALEKQKKFTFIEYDPEQVKNLLVEGGGTIEAIVEKNKIKRLVIDSISSFVLLYKDELTKKEASLALFELIGKWNCTAILTSQAEVTIKDEASAGLDFEVDSIILLYHFKRRGQRKRALEILKMRGTKTPEKVFLSDLTKDGFVIHNKIVTEV